jgi:L-rhamnose-H+ transport protein
MFPIFGIFLHAVGGLAAGSFYMPYKAVKKWAWEVYWIFGGFFSWIIIPWVVAFISIDGAGDILANIDLYWDSALYAYGFGVMWGVGGLTYGLAMRYMGMSLGNSMALGYCALFGTIIPPVYYGQIGDIVSEAAGLVTLGGILVGVIGIIVVGWSGMLKDREMDEETKKKSIEEFNFKKGLWVTLLAGIMSAGFAFGIEAGQPIAWMADRLAEGDSMDTIRQAHATAEISSYEFKHLFSNNIVYIFVMFGGFTTNFIWSMHLIRKNKTGKDYTDRSKPLARNYLFSALAGTIWYFQFMFYGMGTTRMGTYDFASWTIHMTFIILFSNIWGLVLKEWSGVSRKTKRAIFGGLIIIILSTAIIGYGNYMGDESGETIEQGGH